MNNQCLKHVVTIQVAWRAVTCLWSRAVSWAWGEVPVCRAQPWLPPPLPSHDATTHPHLALSRLSFFHFTSLGQISRSASRPRHRPPLAFLSVIEKVTTLLVLGHLWRIKNYSYPWNLTSAMLCSFPFNDFNQYNIVNDRPFFLFLHFKVIAWMFYSYTLCFPAIFL